MIELTQAFVFNTNPSSGALISSIAMCSGTTCDVAGSDLYVSGYGRRSSSDSSSASNVLIYAELS
jgi:hypothetical protein